MIEDDELKGTGHDWLIADSCLSKTPLVGKKWALIPPTGANPTGAPLIVND